jgi:hypothetical protein
VNWNDYTVVGFAEGLTQCQRSIFFAKWGYCGPGYIGYYVNEANAHYNSLQATLEKRFSRGLQLGSSYVWSDTMGSGTGTYFMINPHAEWGTLTSTAPMISSSTETMLSPLGTGSSLPPAFPDGLMA